jgi:AraC-like DNA-binding protein
MKALLNELATREGLHPTAVDGVTLSRADNGVPRTPVLYEPCICVLASGHKKGYVGSRCIAYDENNYLVLSIPLPFECETTAGNNEPLLGVKIRMEASVISELAIKMDVRRKQAATDMDRCIRATPLDARMCDAIVRLLERLRSPVDAAVLGAGIVREIAYYGLCGPEGGALLAMLTRSGPLAQIHAVLHQMHSRYTEPLNVARMAEENGMSVSSFHHHFKAVTASSPLQYLKSVRLHKARMLISMMDLALRLRQIELATRAHRSSAGSLSVFLAIVQWQSRSAFARVSAGLWRNSRSEPRVGRQRISCGSASHCREAGKTGRIGNCRWLKPVLVGSSSSGSGLLTIICGIRSLWRCGMIKRQGM